MTPTLFYDGTCGLCARCVRWTLRHDRRGVLRFAPLQGSTFAALDAAHKPRDVETMVLVDSAGLHLRSDAALSLLRHVGGIWGALAAIGRLVPRFIRDRVYRFVAERRLAWFGTADVCALPAAADRERFLA